MGSFTFTADATTNQLAITAHGLVTGDGPAAVRNVGGSLPSPLIPITDVFIIRDDANHVKLATSNANALAGTFIDLTTAGTGTNFLEIGLPYRRPRTAAVGGQIKSADFNATWDSLVAIYDLLTGQSQSVWSGGSVSLAGNAVATGYVQGSDIYHGDRIKMFNGASSIPATNVTQSSNGSSTGTAAATFTIPLDGFEVGDRLKSVVFTAKGSGAGTMTSQLSTGSGTAGFSTPAQSGSGASVSNPVGTDTDYTLTITSPTAMTASLGAWFLEVQIASAGTLAITKIRATYDRPPP
jgi:hypothetical protein